MRAANDKLVKQLAELATQVAVARPGDAIGYLASLKRDTGLDLAYPKPVLLAGARSTEEHRAEAAVGVLFARSDLKQSLLTQ